MLTIVRPRRAPLRISLPDFDKGHRCPGWSGEGMRFNKTNWCSDELAPGQRRWALTVRRSAVAREGVSDATELPGFFSWRIRRTNCCDTIVLPQFLYLLTPGAWFYVDRAWERADGTRARRRLRRGSGWGSVSTAWWKLRQRLAAG